jgi:hypothetical protein
MKCINLHSEEQDELEIPDGKKLFFKNVKIICFKLLISFLLL